MDKTNGNPELARKKFLGKCRDFTGRTLTDNAEGEEKVQTTNTQVTAKAVVVRKSPALLGIGVRFPSWLK